MQGNGPGVPEPSRESSLGHLTHSPCYPPPLHSGVLALPTAPRIISHISILGRIGVKFCMKIFEDLLIPTLLCRNSL